MTGIVLDTNVVSELQRPEPDSAVLVWMDAQDVSRLWITAVTIGEIALGIALLPVGRRRAAFEIWFDGLLFRRFAGRILPYDTEAGRTFGSIVAEARAQGRTPSIPDAQIAAIAVWHGMTVATRDERGFSGRGV